ncbi:hypothetical protein KR52_10200 [Synechococcus sp. KORDI-52]|nr:hypothetical protein KR52_10200 [Synechococcus sp. KORDI-52]
MSYLDESFGDIPPLKFVTAHEGREAERVKRFIWNRILVLLGRSKEPKANSILEEFDVPPVWDDPLM